jgi:hypothetical protein
LQWYSGAEAQGYYHMLKERFKVRIDVARPDAQSTESSAIAQ